jgi:hypothetical protein
MSTTIQPGAVVTGERFGSGPHGESRTVTGPLLPQDPHDPPEVARLRVPTEDDPATGAQAKIAVYRDTLRPSNATGGSPR